ncbi:hypothetical protein RND81_05G015300 [Saponaria officinalis]|uniref:Uncharacterized protein n=1 Tax=Saponaria officinalis TaxID=3572 RepID=A0AAW1KWC4_SAPOF
MTEAETIHFQTNNGDKLKDAIEAISHSNPKGFGIIEIDSNHGFKIYALNESNTKVNGFMCLEPRNLIDFRCSKPLKNKLINLKFLLRMLQAIDEQSIVFYLEDDDSRLCFESVTYPGIVLGVGLQVSNANYEAFSSTMSPTWETIIPTDGLKTMIPEMIKSGFTQLVTVERTSAETKFSIGETEWKFESNLEVSFNEGSESGRRHHVEFLCSRVDSLKKASSLAEQCSFGLLPSGDVVSQFRFEEGNLALIMFSLTH